jgi:hypothetical protein
MTPFEIMTGILAIASAVVLLYNAGSAIMRTYKAAKAPNEEQNRRITDLETWKETVDRKLDNDHESNRVTHQALLALLDHGLDGNNITQMQKAKDELQLHLLNK